MAITVELYSKRASTMPSAVVDGRGAKKTSWIVPVPFFFMLYIIDDRYLRGEKTTDSLNIIFPRKRNVSFIQTLSPGNQSNQKLVCIIAIKALKKTLI